jgi:diguanylate cyclase (GGDEF)-like protein
VSTARGEALPLDLVSAFAGDRPLSNAEADMIETARNASGDRFHADLLFAITHQHFEPAAAKSIWNEILRHKYEMSKALKRNTRVVVAALDYLSNITGDIISTTLIAEDHVARIIDESLRDGLTGLYNHAYFFRRLGIELVQSLTHERPLSLMMLDVDHFKRFNDLHGHQEGDKTLRSVSMIIEAQTRDTDTACRYGGEEFGIILPSTSCAEAANLAERLRSAIETAHPSPRLITVSIGVAASDATARHTVQSIVKAADEALYRAKAEGRNRVAASGSSPPAAAIV